MQKPQESHLQLQRTAEGHAHVGQVTCARVYHINVILRIKARSTLSRSKVGQMIAVLLSGWPRLMGDS